MTYFYLFLLTFCYFEIFLNLKVILYKFQHLDFYGGPRASSMSRDACPVNCTHLFLTLLFYVLDVDGTSLAGDHAQGPAAKEFS